MGLGAQADLFSLPRPRPGISARARQKKPAKADSKSGGRLSPLQGASSTSADPDLTAGGGCCLPGCCLAVTSARSGARAAAGRAPS